MPDLYVTRVAKYTLLGALFSLGCSSTSSNQIGGGGGSAGETTAEGGNDAHAGSGASSSGAGGTAVGGTSAGGTSPGGTAMGGSGTAGATGDIQGAIIVSQQTAPATAVTAKMDSYGINAIFGPGSGLLCKTTTSGVCMARVCDISGLDGGTPTFLGHDAGDITVTGVGVPTATLSYGAIRASTSMGYSPVDGTTLFFKAGDQLTVKGAGGADLPAFAVQSITAPGAVVLTSAACSGSVCPDLDRTQDFVVTWTGGANATVGVLFETDSDVTHVDLSCDFDAAGGTGTVPHTLLALLGKADSDVTSGIESILAFSSKSFSVGAAPTVFQAQISVTLGLLTVSK